MGQCKERRWASEMLGLLEMMSRTFMFLISGVAQLTIATAAVLQEELESCKQLAELEPDNKCLEWPFLIVLILCQ